MVYFKCAFLSLNDSQQTSLKQNPNFLFLLISFVQESLFLQGMASNGDTTVRIKSKIQTQLGGCHQQEKTVNVISDLC